MRLIGYSIIVAMVLMIIASAASAAVSMTSVGGVESTAQSGAGFGDTYGNFVFNNDDANVPFLNASVWASGQVNPGTTGSFSASYDTGGAKSRSVGTLTTDGFNLKTTVNGKPAIAVSKTSNAGLAYANASMYAEAWGDLANYYAQGTAQAYATAYLSGTGTVSASVPATEISYDAIVATLDPGTVEAVGNVKNVAVTIAGSVDDPNDVISGWGMVGSYSYADEDSEDLGYTYGEVWEDFGLDARKQISFDGPTKITATVTGEEFTEPIASWGTALEAMSDVEATSKLSGLASVYKKNDFATSYADFGAEAYANADTGESWADEWMYMYAYAQRLLADPNAANAARGTAKVDSATWSAASMINDGNTYQTGVEGETGFTENGNGIILSGLGVGAATIGANVVYSEIDQYMWADIDEGLGEYLEVGLQAPQYTGTDTGGVGAYAGLANLNMYLMGPAPEDMNNPFPTPTMLIWTKTVADQNGIWWNNNAILTAAGHSFFSVPEDSIQPTGTGVPFESGPIMWTWQAGGQSGAYMQYRTGTVWV